MESSFIQFGLIILVVLGVSVIMKFLKQPLIIGYIISGILVGPLFLNLIQGGEMISIFSEMGIAFLLFIVGLHLSPKIIKEVGKISLVTGIGQILFTSVVGYFLGMLLGFPPITSIYIAIALTFSSTIIILKLLSDKDSLEKLYGKISIGFLIVQDLVAIIALIVVSSLAGGGAEAGEVLISTLVKGIVIIGILIPISHYILPRFSDFFAKSQELLFVFAISWGLGLSLLFLYAGFSLEVGALIAGVMLSMSPYSFEISSKLKPLRDFFLISFFIILGSQMIFTNISALVVPTIVFSLLVVFGNPLIVIVLMGFFGYSKKTGFMSGLTVAQIGEFSLIFIALGMKAGHVSQEILSFVTLISLITIFGCTYLIMYSEKVFEKLSKVLTIFEKKKIKEKGLPKKKYDYILLGYNRIGFSVIRAFSKITKNFLVIDYNPQIVKELKEEGIDAIYGDVDDSELLEDLGLCKAAVIVSTIPEKETNQLIMDVLKRNKANPITILTSRQISDALELYDSGADYVILPHFLGGEYVSKIIEDSKDLRKNYEKEKRKELKILKERLKRGHQHPEVEKDKK
ncbi:sodium:proton exchanger [Candidatus Pacearchaeota archaeon CG10_big_fil_rev_8_21_14_0_10_32_42]|nr:MAG: sodium:proton exchanger [Candidatus Pacearchaeota archaeon CG10_big_fil_rev_8_21_14_0_10_32_42]